MSYVECFVAPVPASHKEDYIAHASKAAEIFRAHGAVRVVENWESEIPDGELTSFPLAVRRGEGEKIVLGWVEWPSRAARDEGMKAAMAQMQEEMRDMPMPFDGKRLIFGGFDTILEA
ncbi:MAG: DUF1428 domain-containing protein [Pseudomonadota bacterium]